jgi:transcriptional regulator
MYLPAMFAVEDRTKLLAHVDAHPFATLSSSVGDDLVVSHLPLLVDGARGLLRGHLARENSQCEHFAQGARVVAVFHGPHGYVSPSVYVQPGVPTWNYVAVHIRGRARLLDDDGLLAVLSDSVGRFDSSGWRMDPADDAIGSRLKAIAGFEIDIESIEGKWKLSQNRSREERERVIAWLLRGDDASRATAALMQRDADLP